jgi:hypothetical protein
MTTCIRTHCEREVGALSRPHHPLSCGSPECEMFARGYEQAEKDIVADMRLEADLCEANGVPTEVVHRLRISASSVVHGYHRRKA